MILKENIVHYIVFIGILKGIADGFYFFPKNILDTEKISNQDRQKYSGTVNVINNIVSIAIPFITSINLISNYVVTNFSNSKELGHDLKTEFYCMRDILFPVSRCLGFLVLLLVCIILGMDYIHFIMILPAISILIESIVIGRLCKKC